MLIEAPQEEARPRVAYRYIDPGATAGLASLAPGATWSVKLNGVQPLSTLFVNWAFSFGAGEAPDLEIRALDSEGDEVADSIEPEVSGAPATLIARLDSGDTFTVVFENEDDDSPILSRGFSVKGRLDSTWMFVKSVGKEYLITAVAGDLALRAYVRQIPGPGSTSPPLKQTVVVESWQGPIEVVVVPTPTPVP